MNRLDLSSQHPSRTVSPERPQAQAMSRGEQAVPPAITHVLHSAVATFQRSLTYAAQADTATAQATSAAHEIRDLKEQLKQMQEQLVLLTQKIDSLVTAKTQAEASEQTAIKAQKAVEQALNTEKAKTAQLQAMFVEQTHQVLQQLFGKAVQWLTEFEDSKTTRNVTKGAKILGGAAAGFAAAESVKHPIAKVGTCLLITGYNTYSTLTSKEGDPTQWIFDKIEEARATCERTHTIWDPTKNLPPEGAQFFKLAFAKWDGTSATDKRMQELLKPLAQPLSQPIPQPSAPQENKTAATITISPSKQSPLRVRDQKLPEKPRPAIPAQKVAFDPFFV